MNSHPDCIFCKFAANEISVPKIFESDRIFAINDIAPQAPTHILIIPKFHSENAAATALEQAGTLDELFLAVGDIAADLGISDYRTVFNTGAGAGQSVFHAHLHLLAGRAFAWPPG